MHAEIEAAGAGPNLAGKDAVPGTDVLVDGLLVNVVDGDNIKKCTLQDLARLVPKHLFEGILEPKIEAGELIWKAPEIRSPTF